MNFDGYLIVVLILTPTWSAHMIDHVSLGTRRFEDATAFYSACFAALGYRLEHKTHSEAAFGIDGKWDFWLYPVTTDEVVVGQRSHVAVTAGTREKVRQFLEVAIRAGATEVRPAGERPDISPDYFGTMIRDLDGHTVEVVHCSK
jgi:catechol 2,3-dioxygenase-like lactoylglutathione lyase family enzyme